MHYVYAKVTPFYCEIRQLIAYVKFIPLTKLVRIIEFLFVVENICYSFKIGIGSTIRKMVCK